MRGIQVAAAIAAAAMACVTHAQAVESKDNTWKLEDIYANADAWNADAKKLEGQLPELAKCAGHLGGAIGSTGGRSCAVRQSRTGSRVRWNASCHMPDSAP